MAVRQFGRVALGFAGDRLDTELVDLAARGRGEYHAVSQLRKEGVPERIVLIHIQDTRDADALRGSLHPAAAARSRRYVCICIRTGSGYVLVLLFSDTALAAVSGDVLTAAGEFVDGQTAVFVQPLQFAIVVENFRSLILSMESIVVS